jgi:hypothetical protein
MFHAAIHYDFGFAANNLIDLANVIRQGPQEWNHKRESMARFYRASSGEELIQRIQPTHAQA